MAVLSDRTIKERLGHDLIVHPLLFPDGQINGCKVDIHLSGLFYEIEYGKFSEYDPIHVENKEYRKLINKSLNEPYVLHPASFALASSLEHFSLPRDLLGILQGRSSLARMGVLVHATAGFIDPGYMGQITFEFSNIGTVPVKLYPFNRVATVAFLKLDKEADHYYKNEISSPFENKPKKVFGLEPAEKSKFHDDWEHEVLRLYKDKFQ